MEIIFIWIEKYKKIANFQTNFGGELKLSLNNKTLKLEKNSQFIEDFFKVSDFENSISMSTIVGENGTGKSSILDFITLYMNKAKITSDFVLVFKNDSKIYIDSKLDKLKIDNKVSDLKIHQGKRTISNKINSELRTLFFSNVFDIRYFEHFKADEFRYNFQNKSSNVKNISTNSLLCKYDNVNSFLKQDASHQIFFVNEFKEKLEMGKLLDFPEKIILNLEYFEKRDDYWASDVDSLIDEISKKEFLSDFPDLNEEVKIKKEIIVRFLQHYCLDIAEVLENNDVSEENVRNAYYSSPRLQSDFLKMIYINVLNLLKENYDEKYKKIRLELSRVFKKYSNIIEAIKSTDIIEDKNTFYIKENDTSSQNLISLYRKQFYEKRILNFHWSEMSSGQLSLLNLFGRFYNALYELEFDESRKTSKQKISYLLILDECDLYFHPQWQKDWLFHFLRMIEILFKGNVQVILTTHSPFILSDFPNYNVTFLSKTSTVSNQEIEGSPRTFGANINELLTNSFFINDGLMGKFAKSKINTFVGSLISVSPNKVEENKEEIKRFIDIVGEPIIKNKLIQIFNDKILLVQEQGLESRIESLEKELFELKKLQVEK
ncbi:AAA family ATPase [Exiguobacterium sp. NPDC077395]|uniref:AAA family ATPase n=1 Tax=Exiguobacterium sp. NPDC077395 TaxID=3390563 RepID=UPI003D070295